MQNNFFEDQSTKAHYICCINSLETKCCIAYICPLFLIPANEYNPQIVGILQAMQHTPFFKGLIQNP